MNAPDLSIYTHVSTLPEEPGQVSKQIPAFFPSSQAVSLLKRALDANGLISAASEYVISGRRFEFSSPRFTAEAKIDADHPDDGNKSPTPGTLVPVIARYNGQDVCVDLSELWKDLSSAVALLMDNRRNPSPEECMPVNIRGVIRLRKGNEAVEVSEGILNDPMVGENFQFADTSVDGVTEAPSNKH